MKEIMVSERLLILAKLVMDRHTVHSPHCDYHLTEFCNCGLKADKDAYRLELQKVKVVDE